LSSSKREHTHLWIVSVRMSAISSKDEMLKLDRPHRSHLRFPDAQVDFLLV